jgi:hypothetical protein
MRDNRVFACIMDPMTYLSSFVVSMTGMIVLVTGSPGWHSLGT